MIGKPIDQSISVDKCFLISIDWYLSVDDQSITTQNSSIDCYQLAQQPRKDVTHASCPIIPHFLEALSLLNAKIKTRCTCSGITHLPVIAFLCHHVYARSPVRRFTESIRYIVKGY